MTETLLEKSKRENPWFYKHQVSKPKYSAPYKPTSVQKKFCRSCQAETMQVRLVEAFSHRVHWLCRSCGMMVTKP